MSEHEILSDGKTVWINGSDGCCIARFSKFGIDVHKDAKAQQTGGQCLECKAGPLDATDWNHFRKSVLYHYRIEIDNSHCPKFLEKANG